MQDVPAVPRLAAGARVDEVEDALRSAGCAIVERVAPPDLLDRIEAELAPYLAATAPGGDDFAGRNTRRTGALIARSPTFRDLAAHPLVLGALDRVLGDHATSYQLHLTQVIDIGPGEPAQPVHRDQWAFDFFPFPAGFEVECHTMWAMYRLHRGERRDARHPGQQHVGRQAAARRPTRRSPAEMPKGSVLLYIGSLYHGGGANRSTRRGAASTSATRCRGCARRRTSTSPARPRSRASCRAELARLMGYQRGAYALGYFGDLRDPMEALHGYDDRPPRFAPDV